MDASPPDAIEAALNRLAGMDTVPLSGHAAMYEQIHDDLRRALDSQSVVGSPPAG